MTRTLPVLLATVAIGITCCVAAAKPKADIAEDNIPHFNIPRMDRAPKADGAIGADEWRQAVKVMGMVRTSSLDYRDRPITFYVGWDSDHLYIAARTDLLPGGRLWKQKRRQYTTGVVFDDSFEFGLFLHDRNQKPGEASSFMKFILNVLGAGEYMKIYPSIGQNVYNWRPTMDIANRTYKDASGQEWWDMEIAMDLADLEMPRKNQPGDAIDILLAADLKNPGWQWLDVPSASGHLLHHGFPRAVMTADKPYVQVEEFSGLHDQKLHLRSAIYNPSDKPVKVRAAAMVLHYAQAEDGKSILPPKAVVDSNEVYTIPANGSVRLDLDKDLGGLSYKPAAKGVPAEHSEYTLRVLLADDVEAPPVYTYKITFGKSDKSYLKSDIRAVDLVVEAEFNPVQGLLFLAADTLDANIPAGNKPAGMTYKVTRDGQAVADGFSDLYVTFKYEKLVKLPDLAPGKYAVRLALVDADKKELVAGKEVTFEKKDEAKVFAKWWDNKIGDTEKVLQPFTALEVAEDKDGTVIRAIGRAYHLDGLGMPRQIESNGGKVLTTAGRMVVTVDGKDHVVPAAGKLTISDAKGYRVRFQGGPVEVAGVRIRTEGFIEQDGLVELTLTYEPVAGPVKIEGFRIEWPVDDSLGLYMACMGKGNYCPRTIGKVPAGEGSVWSTRDDIGLGGTGMTVGSFMSNVYVGTEKRGLLWTGDSDEGWVPRNEITAQELLRQKAGEVVLRTNIVGTPEGTQAFSLTAPRRITFQYTATPFRPLQKGWRLNQVSAANGFTQKPKYKWNWDTGKEYFTVLSPPFDKVDRWDDYYAHCKEVAHERERDGIYGIDPRLRPYLTNQIALRGYGPKSLEPGVYGYFGGDWVGDSLSKTQRDYFIWLQNRQVREGGCRHFYYDISFSGTQYEDLAAGFGYRLDDGRIQPTYADENLRQWYKRVWALMQETDNYPGGISGHCTNSFCLKAMAWTDAIVDSEYPMKDPIDAYPTERMIALSCPHSFGFVISHLGQMNADWAAMHDTARGGSGWPFSDKQFMHFGSGSEQLQFVPYWRNADLVKKTADGVLVSSWKKPNGIILAVCNYGPDGEKQADRSGRIQLDLKALGVPKGAKGEQIRVRELFPGREISTGHYIGVRWVEEMPFQPHPLWGERIQVKLRPPIEPKLDPATGVLDGFDLKYHDIRYIILTWDDQAFGKGQRIFEPNTHERVLDWGIARATDVAKAELAKVAAVTGDDVKVQAWKQPQSYLFRVTNASGNQQTVEMKLDLKAMDVNVRKLFKDFIGMYVMDDGTGEEIIGEPNWQKLRGGPVVFNGETGQVWVPLKPGQSRTFCIERY